MNSRRSMAYITLVIAAGVGILLHGIWTWGFWASAGTDEGRYLSWFLIALVGSGMKVQLPGVSATMSLNFLFVLIGIAEFNLGEALVMGCLGVLVQCIYSARTRLKPVQVSFSIASVACAIQLAYLVHHASGLQSYVLSAAAYFLANTVLVAGVIAVTESRNVWSVWRDSYFWSFPNYLVGASGAWLIGLARHFAGWQAALLILPVLYLVYRSHNLYVGRLEEARRRAEQERLHAEEVAALHRRTIETLALAVEARDQNTHDHLERVETYAVEVGRELGIAGTDLEALRAAALLHDIGKLAVPEYIISKPGKLTQEEFEIMKTHTVVGAAIVERIGFPYGVAPMVRGHHERWNGKGYPDGLAGEDIPLGARILAAVDCLDALASDRQYRRALPLDEAIQLVQAEAGKSFDPRVVEVLARRYLELNAMVENASEENGRRIAKLPVGGKVERGDAPAAGFERIAPPQATSIDTTSADLAALNSITTDAEQAHRKLAELTAAISHCPDSYAVFATLRASLRSVVDHDAMAICLRHGEELKTACMDGDDFRAFLSAPMVLGEGLSGWVAENGKAVVNGNPSVEPGFLKDPARFTCLRSALSVPLTGSQRTIGVVTLYSRRYEPFTAANLAALTCLGAVVAASLEASLATCALRHHPQASMI